MNPNSLNLARLLTNYTHFCVGSLPCTDPQAAVDFVLNKPWILPFWPELPRRSPRELMIARGMRAFEHNWRGYEADEAAGFFCMREQLKACGRKLPVLKLQVPGAVTLAIAKSRVARLTSAELADALSAVKRQVSFQIECLNAFAQFFVIQFDEPNLPYYEADNAAQMDIVLPALYDLCEFCKSEGAFSAVHACGKFDSSFFDLPFELFSFDVMRDELRINSGMQDQYFKRALSRGALLAPGTYASVCSRSEDEQYELGLATTDDYRRKLSELGFVPAHVLISAACGHAGSSQSWLEKVYGNCAVLSDTGSATVPQD